MIRFLFLVYGLAVVLSWTPVESWAQAASSSDTTQNGIVSPKSKLTRDQAVAAVRSKGPGPGASFQVVREIDSSPAMQEAAQGSLHTASSHHVSLYKDGIFLDLLNTGGFLILEVDDTTGNAISLHLVSSGTDGRAVIESRRILGKIGASLAQELIKQTADFIDVLLATPASGVSVLESRFSGGRFPESDKPAEESFFAIPGGIRKIEADQSEIRDLSALYGAFHFWPIRYAISMPIFPANPTRALDLAGRKHEALVKEFMHRNNENPDLIRDLQDLKSVRTSEQLRDRVATFRRLNDFLEQMLRAQEHSPTFAVNRSISTIALNLGSPEPPEEISYAVMTASGIIVDWKLLNTGDLVVAQVSLAGD